MKKKAGEYQKAYRAGNGPASIQAGVAPGPEDRWVATNPECEGAQIFQTSHRQIAEPGRRALFAAAALPPQYAQKRRAPGALYFLHKIRLNLRAQVPAVC